MSQKDLAYSEQAAVSFQSLSANHTMVAQENSGVVDSLLHPLAIQIRQVLTRAGRIELNQILIDDQENIIQALNAGIAIHSVYYSGDETLSNEMLRRLPVHGRIHEIAKRTCKKLFEKDKVSRVFAIARTPKALGLNDLLENLRDLVALEGLAISGNIGAIIRTSLAFGVGGVVLLNADPVDLYDRRLIRASRGHVFSLPIVTAPTEEFIDFCKQREIPILVMAAQADKLAEEVATLSKRLAIVLGSEKEGCSPVSKAASTLHVQIPTNSSVELLNVSTAAGIMLYNRAWFNIPEPRKQSDL